MSDHPILLVDGNNLIARNNYVFSQAQTPEGFPIGGIFGAIKQVRNFAAANPVSSIVFALDAGLPAFRRQVCPEYKGQRSAERDPEAERMHARYRQQVDACHHLLKPLGVVTARAPDWEGDDTIAALAFGRFVDREVVVYSSDRDFNQLITPDDRVRFYDINSANWAVYDPDFMLKRCLDPKDSDNLDGVPGIGNKKADALFDAFRDAHIGIKIDTQTLEGLESFLVWCTATASAGQHKLFKLCAKVTESQQKVRANFQCTNLRAIVPQVVPALKFRRTVPDKAAFKVACDTYHLRSLLEELSSLWPVFDRLVCPV